MSSVLLELLRTAGVPERVLRHLSSRYFPERWERLAAAHAALELVSVVPALGVGLLGFVWMTQAEPVLFRSEPGPALIVAIMSAFVVSVLGPATLVDAALRWLPDRLRLFLRCRSVTNGILAPPGVMRWAAARVRDARPEAFVDAQAREVRRVHWAVLAVLAVAFACSVMVMLAQHTEVHVSARGVEESGVVSHTVSGWDEVEAVELGCAQVCARDVVRYDLRLAGGRRLEALTGCASAEKLRALEHVDALAREHHVPRRRATHASGAPFWEQGCVERVAGSTGVDASVLARMLALE